MELTKFFIGSEVRRIVFSLKKSSGEYFHIFSILEKIDENMQDYNAFAPNHGDEYNDFDRSSDGEKNKLFITVDKITVTEEIFKKPWENCYSGDVQFLPVIEDYQWPSGENDWRIISSDENENSELAALLPRRYCPSYVRYCIPNQSSEVIQSILTEDSLKTQLKNLSMRNLGYNLFQHSRFLGGFIFITYNDIYRKIDFREKETNDGIYCRLDYMGVKGQPLKVVCKRITNDGGVSPCITIAQLDGSSNLYDVNVGGKFHHLEVDILDKDGFLVDYYRKLVFIHAIKFDMRVGGKEINVLNKEGEIVRKVHKYTEDISSEMGNKQAGKGLMDSSPEYAYQKFENALDFVFYDGYKEKIPKNIARSDKDILRILNNAHKIIYICDVFFDEKSLTRFVLPMDSCSVDLRIISSKKELKADGKRNALVGAINEMKKNGIANVQCRLLIGKKAELHDRFIVADEQVWMLGCSLNEFGSRATTLVRVPKEYRQKLVNRIEEWWNDNTLTEDINE